MSEDYDLAFPTVDIVPYNSLTRNILLGKKSSQNGWRMIGGFFDVRQDRSFEDAAKRELFEEANIKVDKPQYLFSSIVNDPRYIEKKDKIITSVFIAMYLSGYPIAGDDIAEVNWFHPDKLPEIVDEHKDFVKRVVKYLKQN